LRLPEGKRWELLREALKLAAFAGRPVVIAVLTTMLSATPDTNIGAATAAAVLRVQRWWP